MIQIKVIGEPGPQGSKSFKGMRGGKAIMTESSAKVKPWREAVCHAAAEAMGGYGRALINGPVHVEMVFTLRKPKSAPKSRKTYPDRKPDCSKLVRSTEDALTSAGAWEDDARVVSLHASKVFPGESRDSLPVPGAVIRIYPIADHFERDISTVLEVKQ